VKKQVCLFGLLAVPAAMLCGQQITVFSEFQRPGPDGMVVSVDRAPARREILSPALVRNGWASFLFTIEAPAGEFYTIYVAQNPGDTAKVDLYELEYAEAGATRIPDGLKPVRQPIQAALPEGRKSQAYLLDLFLPASTPVERFRLEIQLYVAGRWTIYPMEMRPMEATAPPPPSLWGILAPVSARADATLVHALEAASCKPGGGAEIKLDTLRAVILRNALQDLALARSQASGREDAFLEHLIRAGGWNSREEFCKNSGPAPRGPEWWLRVRGSLYQGLPLPQ
jgi:hypothetical protein